jgi:hypothetical protein
MHRKFPKQIVFNAEEAQRINRIRIAQWLHVTPSAVDAMPLADVEDVMEVMWADKQK